MNADLKRQNFNISPEQDAELAWLQETLGSASAKEVILRALRLLATLVREARRGNAFFLGSEEGRMTRLLIPELEPVGAETWKYLVARPHPWRRQLHVKGRRLSASTVCRDMQANGMSTAQAAHNWDLPEEAIEEILRYCQVHQGLLALEAEEEKVQLESRGVNSSSS